MEYITNSKKILEYYSKYDAVEIAFTQNVCDCLGIAREHTYLKHRGHRFSCVLCISSLQGAKVMLRLSREQAFWFKKENFVSLGYTFYKQNSKHIFVSFFVSSRIAEFIQYGKEQNVYFLQLGFLNKPPDALIAILGNLLNANRNADLRKDERIPN